MTRADCKIVPEWTVDLPAYKLDRTRSPSMVCSISALLNDLVILT